MSKFKGTVAECWSHFAEMRKLGTDKQAVGQLAKSFGLNHLTITRWVNGTMPSGQNALILRRHLELQGYEVIEANETSDQLVIKLRNAIGDRKINIAEAQKALGYNNPQSVGTLIRGDVELTREKRVRLERVLSKVEREEAAPLVRQIPRTGHQSLSPAQANPLVSVITEAISKAETSVQLDPEKETSKGPEPKQSVEDALVTLMIGNMRSFVPLLEYAVSERGAGIREVLRKEPLELFQISNLFSALCSETALRRYQEEKNRRR